MSRQTNKSTTFRQEILDVMKEIKSDLGQAQGEGVMQNPYAVQRKLIEEGFRGTSAGSQCKLRYSWSSILLRLVVIDSFYSTNARMTYFSFEEMADAIMRLGSEQDACKYFYSIAQGGKDVKKLFSSLYGISKNLDGGTRQTSLLSKYAYYSLLIYPVSYPLGFPIYDSLVKKMYSKVFKKLNMGKMSHDIARLKSYDCTIEDYVKALDVMRGAIFGHTDALFLNQYQQFDVLDAYLWRMGKLESGNLSLLRNEVDYKKFITNIGLASLPTTNIYFDDEVKKKLQQVPQPFAGTSVENVMNLLLEHWKKL